jgi:hypothetical protein
VLLPTSVRSPGNLPGARRPGDISFP